MANQSLFTGKERMAFYLAAAISAVLYFSAFAAVIAFIFAAAAFGAHIGWELYD